MSKIIAREGFDEQPDWNPTGLVEAVLAHIATAVAALETENAELRRERDALLTGDAGRDPSIAGTWTLPGFVKELIKERDTLKAAVDRLRGEQDRLYTEINLTNARLSEENARLRDATSAEAGKVVEAARELAGAAHHKFPGDVHKGQYIEFTKRWDSAREELDAALAAYDRAQAQKDQG